eukprot:6204157-Pleurochrysis_carterae.AAC.5
MDAMRKGCAIVATISMGRESDVEAVQNTRVTTGGVSRARRNAGETASARELESWAAQRVGKRRQVGNVDKEA